MFVEINLHVVSVNDVIIDQTNWYLSKTSYYFQSYWCLYSIAFWLGNTYCDIILNISDDSHFQWHFQLQCFAPLNGIIFNQSHWCLQSMTFSIIMTSSVTSDTDIIFIIIDCTNVLYYSTLSYCFSTTELMGMDHVESLNLKAKHAIL